MTTRVMRQSLAKFSCPARKVSNQGVSGMPDLSTPRDLLLLAAAVIALVAVVLYATQRAIAHHHPRQKPRLHENANPVGVSTQHISKQQLCQLIGVSGGFVWQTDDKHRLTLLAGAASAPPSGVSAHWLNRPLRDVGWTPCQADEWQASDWQDIEGRLDQRLPVRITLRSDTPGDNGGQRFFELSGQPVHVAGRFAGYLGIGRDITPQINADHAMLESQARYRDVVDSVREVMFRVDAQISFTFLNRAWEVCTDLSVATCLGRCMLDFIHPDDRDTLANAVQRVLSGEVDEYHGQLRLPSRHGEIRWIEATLHLVTSGVRPARPTCLAGTFVDISSRKVAEMTLKNVNQELESRVRMRTAELEASNRELEAFSYSVSHDLMAPLRSIDGFARILEEDLGAHLDHNTREHLERIRKAAGRMAYLIDRLLGLARLSQHTLRKETVNLSDLALQVFEELRAEDPSRMVEAEITRDLTVTADKTLMRVLLENLLRNAWKFTARRELAHISFHAELKNGKRVFCVTDNGVGFDMAFATHLFRAFHRLHDNAEFPGAGIGLANVQRIILRHGGRVWARSEPDRGARFYFTLDT